MQRRLILQADVAGGGWVSGPTMGPVHMLRRDVRAHRWDYSAAAAMVTVALVALVTRIDVEELDAHRFRADTWWSWALTLAVCATVAGRRRWPLRAFGAGLVLVVPLELGRHRDSVAFFALVLGLYSVAAHLPGRLAWRGVAMVAAEYAVLVAGGATIIVAAPLVGNVMLAAAFSLGRILRTSRARHQRAVEAAAHRAALARELAAVHAADERLRLAQELHDVVAHSLSVIAVQAGIGAHLIERRPAEAARALEAIRTTTGSAADELGRLVELLRDGSSQDTATAPALSGVAALAEQIGAAGVPVQLTVTGGVDAVPEAVSLAAYRIVQEALTNVVRHAGRAQAAVTVAVSADRVELRIDDDGLGIASGLRHAGRPGGHAGGQDGGHDGGHGLIGMGERARMYGGELRAGPRPGGGFRVDAELHFHADPASAVPRPGAPVERTGAGGAADRPRLPSWVWDAALACLIGALTVLQVVLPRTTSSGPQYAPSDLLAWLLRASICAPLVLRHRSPTAALAVMWMAGIALTFGDYEVGVLVFAMWIGIYSVACFASRKRVAAALVGTYAGTALLAWSRPPDLTATGAIWVGFLFTAAALAGYVVRLDRERRVAEIDEREGAADALSMRARLVVAGERLRIADELSTIVTRSIGAVAEEARAAAQVVDRDPAAAGAALQAISVTSREALNDLRRLLKHMRNPAEPAVHAPIGADA